MSTVIKGAGYIALVCLLFFGIVRLALGEEPGADPPEPTLAKPEDSPVQYKINSYTAPEQAGGAKVPARNVPEGMKLMAENESLQLFASNDAQSVMIKNKATGYVWSSVPDETTIAQARLNEEWGAAVRSPFLVEYFDESAMQNRGSYRSLGAATQRIQPLPDGFSATYALENIGVTFAMEVKLEADSLVVRLPDQAIVEKGAGRLSSIQPFPFLGAVRKNERPGYIFIPDGSGALIRFQQNHPQYDQAFEGRVYGLDMAVESVKDRFTLPEQPIMMPVFGFVHGVKQNGFIGIIEDGKYNARISAYPSGVNTDFYWASPKFMLRYPYFQPTSKSMGGFNTYQKERNRDDRQVRYMFLSGKDADYVGMAKAYRGYLEEQGVLAPKRKSEGDIPLKVEMLGAEKTPGLIGNRVVKMTSFEEAESIIDRLQSDGIRNISAVFQGWNSGGVNGNNPDKFPVSKDLGGKQKLMRLKEDLEQKGVSLYLYNDYTNAFGSNDHFNPKVDGLRTAGNRVMSDIYYLWFDAESSADLTVYFMNPTAAGRIAAKDVRQFADMGIDALALDKTGWILYSDFNPKDGMSRAEAADEYQKLSRTLREQTDKLAYYKPFDYMWRYADQMYEMPLYSSQYMFATDTVPFLQTVLHGYRDYFAPNVNYNANPQEYMLRMIEYGAYPSYYVMNEPSWKLKDTLSNHLFTSYFEDWRADIKTTYEKVNSALKQVQNAAIEERNVLDWGVVEVVYSNGVKIIVNYRQKDMQVRGRTVPPMGFVTVGGE
ncbi:hypothetical protein BG53_05575 [Paenibacillus darwinianus]|uniref:Uncharacterized protein n=1 Tax=Paenibacillus darwinianus TaxID=1380763 RepID=A0A9W5S0I5_9BACL|nr:DUF5696 domain-containing protein [Paenibacillus darwinianus]EXX86721.1 hypothetical protein BG53_05575 [Paenibacillus darwinianus]EXX86739.1 hypothetical protein CH50_06735 [Paenibacillus darwinianus]EXX87491.1 hypothetical protein BG52_04070 [Paenibacillus darwinianus]